MGRQIISGPAQLCHHRSSTLSRDLERASDWPFPENNPYDGSFTFLAIQYDQVGSPPAHRHQIQPQILRINVNQSSELNSWAKTCRSSSPSATDSTLRDLRLQALTAGTSPTLPKLHSGRRACDKPATG